MSKQKVHEQDKIKPKEITNPFSTGGGGVSYEQRVAAYYMVSLMAQHRPLGLLTGVTQWIRFQARQVGATVDDLLVQSNDNAHVYHIQLQIKHDLTFTDNPLFREVLTDAWFAFTQTQKGDFDFESDRIGVVLPSYARKVEQHLLKMLSTARTCISEADFLSKISTPKHTSNEQREYLALFRKVLTDAAGRSVSDEQLWKFLKCLFISSFR